MKSMTRLDDWTVYHAWVAGEPIPQEPHFHADGAAANPLPATIDPSLLVVYESNQTSDSAKVGDTDPALAPSFAEPTIPHLPVPDLSIFQILTEA
ncbi:hypothetical protein SI65_08832 [Aspergillus cristatus]|uniref:Uncharacterized protein n=1 Tax=Aspergillus cristatus TaxID=573508 RepID=A0A1E3B3Y1_ASPCR|nr:hypothetical protein SI65_08832 [Aspergillus cristatus]